MESKQGPALKEHSWGDGWQRRKQKRTGWFQSVVIARTTLKQGGHDKRNWAEEGSAGETWKEQTIWDSFLALLPSSWVTLGKLLHLSEAQSQEQEMGTIMPSPRAGVRVEHNTCKIPGQRVHCFLFPSATGLSCGTQDLPSLLWHPGFLVRACELLVAACGF